MLSNLSNQQHHARGYIPFQKNVASCLGQMNQQRLEVVVKLLVKATESEIPSHLEISTNLSKINQY